MKTENFTSVLRVLFKLSSVRELTVQLIMSLTLKKKLNLLFAHQYIIICVINENIKFIRYCEKEIIERANSKGNVFYGYASYVTDGISFYGMFLVFFGPNPVTSCR